MSLGCTPSELSVLAFFCRGCHKPLVVHFPVAQGVDPLPKSWNRFAKIDQGDVMCGRLGIDGGVEAVDGVR